MKQTGRIEDWRPLAAALILCLAFGSIHAYSVLLAPLEQRLGASRADVSLGYSFAIVALTAGVFASATLRKRLSPRGLLGLSGSCALTGLLLTSTGSSLASLLIGYGLLFGLGNGLAYSLSLSLAAQSSPARSGWAMGLATAVYGLGSVVFAQLLGFGLKSLDLGHLLMLLAIAMFLACLAAMLLTGRDTPKTGTRDTESAALAPRRGRTLSLWLIYLLGASSGLMVIAHATEIVASLGPETSATAASLVGIGSISGGYLGGVLAGMISSRFSLSLPMLLMAAALGLLFLFPTPELGLLVMLVAGLCYGTLISVIPAMIRNSYGTRHFAAVFGVVFTAWGVAGLAGPALAGFLFDLNHNYGGSILAAATMSLTGGLLSLAASPD